MPGSRPFERALLAFQHEALKTPMFVTVIRSHAHAGLQKTEQQAEEFPINSSAALPCAPAVSDAAGVGTEIVWKSVRQQGKTAGLPSSCLNAAQTAFAFLPVQSGRHA